jgi:hypothetical protein
MERIIYVYRKERETVFSCLDDCTVSALLSSIQDGSYALSPLYSQEVPRDSLVPSTKDMVVLPTLEDMLILRALAMRLEIVFMKSCVFASEYHSYYSPDCYQNYICQFVGEEGVSKLLYLDLTRALESLSHSRLLLKLELVVGKTILFELVSSFLSIPIIDIIGERLPRPEGVGVPPVNPISMVLVNFLLDDLDRDVIRGYPYLPYGRYLYGVLIPFSLFELSDPSLVKEGICRILFDQRLYGDLFLLSPGQSPPLY